MSLLHLWFAFCISLLFGGAGLWSMLLNVPPSTPNAPIFLLLLVALLITTISMALHLALRRAIVTSLVLGLRRGLLVSGAVGLMLYLSAGNLLSWWNSIPLLSAMVLIEIYFLVRLVPGRTVR